MTANELRVSFLDDKHVLNLIVVTGSPLGEYTKNHYERVNFMDF